MSTLGSEKSINHLRSDFRVVGTLLICLLLLFSCKNYDKSNIIIEGSGLDGNINKLYLTTAAEWDVFVDSTVCIKGEFKFKYKPKDTFEPFLASICYLDEKKKLKQLYFRNQILIKRDRKNHANSGFMLDYGKTILNNYKNFEGYDLFDINGGGEENKLFQLYESENFGFVSSKNEVLHKRKIDYIIKKIEKYPFSFFFLERIVGNRESYSKNELQKILNSFDNNVQNSRLAGYLKEYMDNLPTPGQANKSLSLMSSSGAQKEGINKTAKLNMLIFWASWCGPCRMEIPELKIIQKQLIENKNFYMASISIDENKKSWHDALKYEKLTWDQFIIDKNDINKITAEYGFSSIPLVVFVDKQGKEVARYSGYDPKDIMNYKKVINDHLKLNIK